MIIVYESKDNQGCQSRITVNVFLEAWLTIPSVILALKKRDCFGLRANRQSANALLSTFFNLQLNNENVTISEVRYQRWQLNALAALFETELSTA